MNDTGLFAGRLLRCTAGLPVLLALALLNRVAGHPDALEAAGNLLSMWMLAGRAAPADDIGRAGE